MSLFRKYGSRALFGSVSNPLRSQVAGVARASRVSADWKRGMVAGRKRQRVSSGARRRADQAGLAVLKREVQSAKGRVQSDGVPLAGAWISLDGSSGTGLALAQHGRLTAGQFV